MNMKDKLLSVTKNLQNLLEDSKSNRDIDIKLTLSEDQALILQFIKVFVYAIDNSLTDQDIINMIFLKGLSYEADRIRESKQEIYDMGNLEMLADEKNIGLTDESREIASAILSTPKTIDEYWELGYTTMQCPLCQARAVWHFESNDYQCIDGCRKSGILGDSE